MNINPGTYNLGPSDGAVRVKTGRQGMASKVGHDLTLDAGNWKATVTIDGQSRPVTLDMAVTPPGRLSARTTVVQTQFGIKPFSAMMGALKVKDEVEVDLDVRFPHE